MQNSEGPALEGVALSSQDTTDLTELLLGLNYKLTFIIEAVALGNEEWTRDDLADLATKLRTDVQAALTCLPVDEDAVRSLNQRV
eukprot:CAMPEP_0184443564 /NCGR_PEP_ID=MMETSP0740-20130409/529_1 /TAXON_ID=385413 /ORGANISM="Thalassiosira miniscula, Strain CCMP1093" /LENGTH=84 /DNA_ID=CAMNT_0026811861 /DNA_START=518 /DNA_END=769 /DNA_ORIENTATION=+